MASGGLEMLGVRECVPPLGACIPKPRPPQPLAPQFLAFPGFHRDPREQVPSATAERCCSRLCLHGGFLSPGGWLHPKPGGDDLWSVDRPCVLGTFVSWLARVLGRTSPEGQPVRPLRKATWWSVARQGWDQILAHSSHLWPASPKCRQRYPREFSGQISSLCKEVIGIRYN